MSQDRTPPSTVVILVGTAAFVIVTGGITTIQGIAGPAFLALCLTVTVNPLRNVFTRAGLPRWVGTVACVLVVYAVLLALVWALISAIAKFAQLVSTYQDQFSALIDDVRGWLSDFGISGTDITDAFGSLDVSSAVPYVTGAFNSVTSVTGNLLLVLLLLLFMAIDGAVVPGILRRLPERHQRAVASLSEFASGTRRYFLVSTVFGLIVALLDVALLYALGVPEPWVWGVLSLITNYIPNIGFVIGLVPPALLAGLDQGWGTAVWVVIGYSAINFVVQSVIQPKIVGDSVGLSVTVSMLSLVFWTLVLGAWGAILAIPATLLVKKLLVDSDPELAWLSALMAAQEPDDDQSDGGGADDEGSDAPKRGGDPSPSVA